MAGGTLPSIRNRDIRNARQLQPWDTDVVNQRIMTSDAIITTRLSKDYQCTAKNPKNG